MADTYNIYVPVCRGVLPIKVEKGDRWSEIEHILLFALTQKSYTLQALSEYSSVPYAMVADSVVRLMRAGWVKIDESEESILFCSTDYGCAVADDVSLPFVPFIEDKYISYVVDYLTGSVFRRDEFGTIITGYNLKKISAESPNDFILDANPSIEYTVTETNILANLFTSADEVLISCDLNRGWVDKLCYAKLSVIPGKNGGEDFVEGLPQSRYDYLRGKIINAISTSPKAGTPKDRNITGNPVSDTSGQERSKFKLDFSVDDFIVGDLEHREILRNALKNAKSHIVIHSTFIHTDRIDDHFTLIEEAAKRQVRIDILWDCDDSRPSYKYINKYKDHLRENKLSRFIHLHMFPTKSHAKFIFYDNGFGEYFVIIGSCNWFYSRLNRVEASVRLRKPEVVADFLDILIAMLSSAGIKSTSLVERLIPIVVRLKRKISPPFDLEYEAQLITCRDHENIIIEARDSARESIFIASHRLGGALETQILVPASSAAQSNNINVHIQYGENSGPAVYSSLHDNLRQIYPNILIEEISGFHAKILCWDTDNVVITSLNWLSKDANQLNNYSEIGVRIAGKDAATIVKDKFNTALKRMRGT